MFISLDKKKIKEFLEESSKEYFYYDENEEKFNFTENELDKLISNIKEIKEKLGLEEGDEDEYYDFMCDLEKIDKVFNNFYKKINECYYSWMYQDYDYMFQFIIDDIEKVTYEDIFIKTQEELNKEYYDNLY